VKSKFSQQESTYKNMIKNIKIVVIGGSGLIGKKLVSNLRQRGHDAVPASPSSGVNTITGEGLPEALKGAHVVDVVASLADVALGDPINGMIEIAGPEQIRQDELVRQFLNATGDARKVIADTHARYYGIEVNDQSLVPTHTPHLGPTRFAEWLSHSNHQEAAK
jgi:uncharacterized protein YbjT (DUF2867 family)